MSLEIACVDGGSCWSYRNKRNVEFPCEKCHVQAQVLRGADTVCALCFSAYWLGKLHPGPSLCRGTKCEKARQDEEDRRKTVNVLIPEWRRPAAAAAPPTTLPPAAAAAQPPPPPPLPAGAAADVTVQWQISDVMTDLAEIKTSLARIMAALQDRNGTGHADRQDLPLYFDWRHQHDGTAEWRRTQSEDRRRQNGRNKCTD